MACASVLRWRRSPISTALAISRGQMAGTAARTEGKQAATESAYGSVSSLKYHANASEPSRTNSLIPVFFAFLAIVPHAHHRAAASIEDCGLNQSRQHRWSR